METSVQLILNLYIYYRFVQEYFQIIAKTKDKITDNKKKEMKEKDRLFHLFIFSWQFFNSMFLPCSFFSL